MFLLFTVVIKFIAGLQLKNFQKNSKKIFLNKKKLLYLHIEKKLKNAKVWKNSTSEKSLVFTGLI